MRTIESKMEHQGLVEIGQEVEATERVGTSSCSYIIEPTVATSGCYTGRDRIESTHGIMKDIKNNDRGYHVIVDFDEQYTNDRITKKIEFLILARSSAFYIVETSEIRIPDNLIKSQVLYRLS